MENLSAETTSAENFFTQPETTKPLEWDGLPPVALREKELWYFFKNGEDGEIKDASSTAERWARKMQRELPRDATEDDISALLEELWLTTYNDSCEEFSEHSLNRAVTILSRCWQYGDILRALHTARLEEKSEASDDGLYTHGVL